jgi:hypothetical protein
VDDRQAEVACEGVAGYALDEQAVRVVSLEGEEGELEQVTEQHGHDEESGVDDRGASAGRGEPLGQQHQAPYPTNQQDNRHEAYYRCLVKRPGPPALEDCAPAAQPRQEVEPKREAIQGQQDSRHAPDCDTPIHARIIRRG